MKKVLNLLPNWLILPIISLLFLATWPLWLIVMGVKVLFDEKTDDTQKIAGAKVAVLILSGLIAVAFLGIHRHALLRFFDQFPWWSLFISVIVALFVLAILQKTFPSWKWLKKKSELS